MKEIGGYFGLEQFCGKEYHEGLIPVNNARSALRYSLRARKIKKLYLPYFLCDSVSGACKREAIDYSYYPIDRNFLPIFDQTLQPGEWLYVVNYYGQLTDAQILALKKKFHSIILDNVQDFFRRPLEGIDTIYSCRKFFGVPDGGYLATDVFLTEHLEQDISRERMKHILGRFEGTASEYHADFKRNDQSFAEQPLRAMSLLTHNLLRAIDYSGVREARNTNYQILEQALGAQNALSLIAPNGPYKYPFYCKNGMAVKRQLAGKKIYVATLWPNVLALDGTLEKEYAENILPLPCDQRYGADEMEYVIKEVLSCIS